MARRKAEAADHRKSKRQDCDSSKRRYIVGVILVGVIGIGCIQWYRLFTQPGDQVLVRRSSKLNDDAQTATSPVHNRKFPKNINPADPFNKCEMMSIISKRHPSNQHYDLKKYSGGVIALSVDKFMSAALRFCHNEARQGEIEIISIGSGTGVTENEIIKAYRATYKKDIKITLVDINTRYEANYRTVDELIRERPEVIGNCVLLINWPEPQNGTVNNYDIDAVDDLRPKAVLAVYETMGSSGSLDFVAALHNNSFKLSPEEYGIFNFDVDSKLQRVHTGRLRDYSIEEVALQKVTQGQFWGTRVYRMVILRKEHRGCGSLCGNEDEFNRKWDDLIERNDNNFINLVLYLGDLSDLGLSEQDASERMRSEVNGALRTAAKLHPSNALSHELENNLDAHPFVILMKEIFIPAAVDFCRIEAYEKNRKIIFLGRSAHMLGGEIIAAYRKRYGGDVKITFIDWWKESKSDFKSVEELVRRHPEVVGHSSLFIFCPLPASKDDEDDGADIDSVRQLRPHSVLAVYETNGLGGSYHFQAFLRNDSFELPSLEYGLINMDGSLHRAYRDDFELLDDFSIEELALKKVPVSRLSGTIVLRMVLLRRKESELIHR